jgi:DNA-binding SARP family transcriptional activator
MFSLLGTLEVRRNGVIAAIPAGRQRALLAALLLNANRVVSADELIETLWEGDPPASVRVSLQNYVKRLRQNLGDTGHRQISTYPPGYLITIPPGSLDVTRFETLTRTGLKALRSGGHAEAAGQLREALSLWRGPPLADVDSHFLSSREVPRLAELRLQALESRIEADLALGRSGELVPELRLLAATHPLRERLHALLMLALHGAGQQAGALAAYLAARSVLTAELGIEPSRELQELQRTILAGERCPDGPPGPLAASPAAIREPGLGGVVPRQLPAGVQHFAGRADKLAALDGLLDQLAGQGTAVITAVGGMAGVGKTTLALHWAQRVTARFPDGQLYVNLRGFGPAGQPVEPGEAIFGFLEAFHFPGDLVPHDLDARAALYRSILAGRQLLLLLDNARDAGQVRPLLPGSPGCFVLITSRNPMTSLAAAEGAHCLILDPLAESEARELLASRLGSSWAAGRQPAATELIELCGRLPLALGIAAARAASGHGLTLTALVEELRAERGRLDALEIRDGADPSDSVRAVFWWSYRNLSAGAARMFRLLGLQAGPDISRHAAASLAAVPLDQASRALSELVAAQLLTEQVPGRFAFHDLVRAYAIEQAAANESEAECRSALSRVLDHYLHTAHCANVLLYSSREAEAQQATPAAGTVPERFTSCEQALGWLQSEQQVLVTAVSMAADRGFDAHAGQLAGALCRFLSLRGDWHNRTETQRVALAAAQRLGDQVAQARAHRGIGAACTPVYGREVAETHLRRALALYRNLGDRSGEGGCLYSLSQICEQQGEYGEALRCAEQALSLYRDAGDKAEEAWALNAVGWLHVITGSQELARSYCEPALTIHREFDDNFGQACTLHSIAQICHKSGLHAEATALYRDAVVLWRRLGDRGFLAVTIADLGDAYHASGDTAAARQSWQQALAIMTDLHHPQADQVHARLTNAAIADRLSPAP